MISLRIIGGNRVVSAKKNCILFFGGVKMRQNAENAKNIDKINWQDIDSELTLNPIRYLLLGASQTNKKTPKVFSPKYPN